MTTSFKKISELPTIQLAADADRIVILTNTDSVPLLQTISYHMLANSFSQNYVNTGSPIISNSLSVNTTFVANSLGVYVTGLAANIISTNTITAYYKIKVGQAAGYDFGSNAVIEIDASQNTFVQSVIQNANSGTNASGDLVITADTGNDSINYVDFGINSSNYTNTVYSLSGALDAYLYSSNSNLVVGTASNKAIIFHANGTTTTDRKFTINATSVVVANSVAFNANTGTFLGQVNTGTLNVSGDLTVSGNVTLAGNTTFVNATVITTKDLNLVLANGTASAAAADGAGLVVGTYANLVYDNGTNTWQSNVGITPISTGLNLGNTNLKWDIYANNLSVTNVTATASVNVGSNVQISTQGITVSNSISSTLITNNSIYIGNSVSNSYINSTAVYISGYIVNTSLVSFGNSTVNGAVSNSSIYVANSTSNITLYSNSLFVGNTLSNVYINSSAISINGYIVNNSISAYGNSTVNSYINSISSAFNGVGISTFSNSSTVYVTNTTSNVVLSAGSVKIGNSVSNVTINSSSISVSGSSTSAANGYTIMTNGFKMNWGWVSANSSVGTATFTSAYSTNAYTITATSNSTVATYQAAVIAWTGSSASIRTANAASTNVFWMAIGV